MKGIRSWHIRAALLLAAALAAVTLDGEPQRAARLLDAAVLALLGIPAR